MNSNLLPFVIAAVSLEQGLGRLLRVIMLFAYLLAVALLILGGWQIKQGQGTEGKMSILGAGLIGGATSLAKAIFEGWGEGAVTFDVG